MASMLPVTRSSALNLEETKLTLGLPGGSRSSATSTDGKIGGKTRGKRGFCETIDLNIGSSGVEPLGKDSSDCSKLCGDGHSTAGKTPPAKAQVVGWPPVRSFRKNSVKSSCTYIKVAVDGAPYLRKVDLKMYRSYQELLNALEEMFSCLTIQRSLCESRLMDLVNGTQYVPTYEDKDGDWMLVGDVPWKMFVESCKRLRLMKSSEAAGLASRTPDRRGNSS
ncbi:auxin-responsive protein IAA16-like [Aristolochia californica]|uniref:auxin-responsive protein IAA16-like n=1 Tax=Aristolochia californica TaxID=171875 RepID=UPI0035E0D2CE